jgi:hypothetical protein
MTEKPFAFVLMPFEHSFDDIYRLGIKAAAEESGFNAERVDEQVFHREGILARIYGQIEAADIIIADMTGRNPNVFYEVGYAHAKGKLCVLLTQNANDIPFDLKHHRHIVYDNKIVQLKELLSTDLSRIKQDHIYRQNPISVDIHVPSYGDIEFTSYSAIGEISIKFDITSNLSVPVDLEALYLYTGESWDFKQDGHDCPYSTSDLSPFKRRHFVKPPLRRLVKGGWAQVILKGTRVLDYGKKERLKDSYKTKCSVGVRVFTTEKAYDYTFNLGTEFTEMPF